MFIKRRLGNTDRSCALAVVVFIQRSGNFELLWVTQIAHVVLLNLILLLIRVFLIVNAPSASILHTNVRDNIADISLVFGLIVVQVFVLQVVLNVLLGLFQAFSLSSVS